MSGQDARAVQARPRLTTIVIADGFDSPLFLTSPPADASRLFVVERFGRIRIIEQGTVLPRPFLDIEPKVAKDGERGLLGLAFHPDYARNGLLYVNYTRASDGWTLVERYRVLPEDPNVADPDSALPVISIEQPARNHNAGWLGFGPDGLLYVPLGDGGAANRREQVQDPEFLLGKVLRIDVNGDDFPGDPAANYAIPPDNPYVGRPGRDEVWAVGLRNPYRCSFDRLTGDLYLADVGGGQREEICFQPAASRGGENYGWPCLEGTFCHERPYCKPCDAETFTRPIFEYARDIPGCTAAVIGGYVYRGAEIPALRGTYFFGDLCGRVWSFRYDGRALSEFAERTEELQPFPQGTLERVYSFGEDAQGELYLCDRGGQILKIVAVGERCDAVSRFKARCHRSNRITARLAFLDRRYAGQSVTFAIDGQRREVVVDGRKARLTHCCQGGEHVVSLEDPQYCKPPIQVACRG
ncbi:MAG: hypothetical protein C4547_06690 [Phycisphaerales bacterium]|nr:MAG: hypothetical protein C4547_06690 [Phycisphaerales bacterium]